MRKILILIAVIMASACLIIPVKSFASVKVYERDYTYQASEIDSKVSCRVNALIQVKKLLLEELVTYLESYTEVKNYQLTKDKITVITAGFVNAKIISEKWDGEKYWLKAQLTVHPEDIVDSIRKLRYDREKIKELERINNKLDNALLEIESLKKKVKDTKNNKFSNKKIQEYNANIKKITALDYYLKASAAYEKGQFDNALYYIEKSIETLPSLFKAHAYKIVIYTAKGQRDKAIQVANDVILMNYDIADPENYILRGFAYRQLYKPKLAIAEINKGINMNYYDLNRAYRLRGSCYGMLNETSLALRDIEAAIKIQPDNYKNYKCLSVYYCANKKDYYKALDNINKAIKMNPEDSYSYYYRGQIYERSGKINKAKTNYFRACELGYEEACHK